MSLYFLMILLVPFAVLYVAGSALLVAYLSRRIPLWARLFGRRARRQLQALSAARISVTIAVHVVALVMLIRAISTRQELPLLALYLFSYMLVAAALTLSLLAQMPYFKRLWDDAFMKVSIVAAPLMGVYLAQGYAAYWVSDTLNVSAKDAPMAHLAATGILTVFGVALFFMITTALFEVASLFPLASKKAKKAPQTTRSGFWSYVAASLALQRRPGTQAHRDVRTFYVGAKLGTLAIVSFVASMTALYAGLSLLSTRSGGALMSASAFLFDAVPATLCDLTAEERKLSTGDEPIIKALMLSGGRGVLIRRAENLFDPTTLRDLGKGPKRSLSVVRSTQCFSTSTKAAVPAEAS